LESATRGGGYSFQRDGGLIQGEVLDLDEGGVGVVGILKEFS
jgi:hypothetical protein